jgi:hypothetical protein
MTKLEELKDKRDVAWGDLRTADAARDAADAAWYAADAVLDVADDAWYAADVAYRAELDKIYC